MWNANNPFQGLNSSSWFHSFKWELLCSTNFLLSIFLTLSQIEQIFIFTNPSARVYIYIYIYCVSGLQDTAGDVEMNSQVMYSCGPLHMDEQRQDIQLELTYSSSVLIQDIAMRTCRKQWTIGRCGKRGSEISVLIAWHDDDDIYCYSQTDCFIVSQLFKVVRHTRHSKPGLKPA